MERTERYLLPHNAQRQDEISFWRAYRWAIKKFSSARVIWDWNPEDGARAFVVQAPASS